MLQYFFLRNNVIMVGQENFNQLHFRFVYHVVENKALSWDWNIPGTSVTFAISIGTLHWQMIWEF